mmetsp:Transcript_6533/g.20597  ORF Transcript_6533/g.20597 Transcript_6533/m.20597 type:complete len:312 (+) Transcript_6533:3127-4062(+)
MQPKRRWAPKASRFGWPTIAPPSSRDYALKKYRVDRYHAKTHRSRFLIENDILASIAKGLEPGDTRYMSPCRWCWLHQDHLRARHFYPDWHLNEIVYGPAEGWHLDVLYLTVPSALDGFKYIFIFVDIDSGFIIDIGTKKLDTDSCIAVFTTFVNRVAIELKEHVELIFGDFFATFREVHRLAAFKRDHKCIIEVNSPYRHFRNLVENIIRWLRHTAVIKLFSAKVHRVAGSLMQPDRLMPEAIRHTVCVFNDSSNTSILRKFDLRGSPRQRASGSKSPSLPLFEFLEEVSFVLPNEAPASLDKQGAYLKR